MPLPVIRKNRNLSGGPGGLGVRRAAAPPSTRHAMKFGDKPRKVPPRRGKPHGLHVGERLKDLEATVIALRVSGPDNPPGKDSLTLKYDCCGAEVVMTVAALRRIRKKDERVYINLCQECAKKRAAVTRGRQGKIKGKTKETAFQHGPTWSKPQC